MAVLDLGRPDTWPALLTMSELADVFRATAKNRSSAGRRIAERHDLPLVEGHRPGIWLAPAWPVKHLLGLPTDRCPVCDAPCGPAGCTIHPPVRKLEAVS